MGADSQVEDLFYGAVKVGERGQVVIPAEARRQYDLSAGERLLVFGHPFGDGIVLIKVDSIHELLTRMTDRLARLQQDAADDGADEGGDPE